MRRVRLSTALWLATVSALGTAVALGPSLKAPPAMSQEVSERVPALSADPVERDRIIFRKMREEDWARSF